MQSLAKSPPRSPLFCHDRCSEELRFKVGDTVLAKVGGKKGSNADGYHPGVVLKLWDQGNAYRIQLSDEKKTNVWGPIDEDKYVMAAAA